MIKGVYAMKIVHVIDYFSPQLGYQETYLAKEQMRLGHDVTVITSERYFPFPDYKETVGPLLGPRLVKTGVRMEDGITVHRLPVLFEAFTRCFLFGLEDELVKVDPDVIHIHSVCSLSAVQVALFRKRLPRARILCDDHSHYSVITDNWSKRIYYGVFSFIFSKILSSGIDSFVAITDETKEIMMHIMHISKSISVIELGADTNLFRFYAKKRREIRKKYNIKNTDFVILYTGKIIPQKGVDVLVKAFLQLRKDNVRLMIIGNGDPEYIKRLNQAEGIVWVSMVMPKKLSSYYSAADVGVWPKQESISMIEASSCRLPIIIKKSDSMSKRIANDNGIMYDEGNTDQLLSALRRIYAMNGHDRIAMGKRGRELVLRNYGWTSITKKFISEYTKGLIHV